MLKDLIASIRAQDFDQSEIEILVITEGDSEEAKAIGIRQATGEICAMFCADNYISSTSYFTYVKSKMTEGIVGVYDKCYAYVPKDNSLNRYFSLMGNNDPICFYLGKSDRRPWYEIDKTVITEDLYFKEKVPSLGDNGFFFFRKYLLAVDLDHYYPMDIAEDLRKIDKFVYRRMNGQYIWHRTSDNLISFLIKRYKYAKSLYCDRTDRRWKILDTREDYIRLGWFILSTCTVLPALIVSFRGYRQIRDYAWFWHFPVCLGFTITYTILALRNWIKYGRLFQCPQPA